MHGQLVRQSRSYTNVHTHACMQLLPWLPRVITMNAAHPRYESNLYNSILTMHAWAIPKLNIATFDAACTYMHMYLESR